MRKLVGLVIFGVLATTDSLGAGTSPSSSALASTTKGAAVTLKIGQVGGISDAAIYIADAKGYFKDQGIALESFSFPSAAQMVAPLGIGELQVGGGATSAGLFNAIGRRVGVLIVADKGNMDPGNGYEAIVVRKELAAVIKGPKDLKGRTVAISALDIGPEVTLDTYLRQAGLTEKDVNLVTVPHADMLQALKNGSIDVGVPIEPFVSRIVAAGVADVLVRDDAVTPGHQVAVVLFSEKFAQQRELAVRFMKAYVLGARFYNDAFRKRDPAKRAEAVEILAKATKVDPALFKTMVMPGINPDGRVNLDSLTEIQTWFVKKGSQQKFIELSKAVDLSFVKEAIRLLGPYQ
jgi:NitT/TauT family transport system substrate-binding protein